MAVGDECVIGEQAYIAPDVKIYPFKTVDSGAQIQSSIIWESRGTPQLFGKDGIAGLINIDITAELALKLAMAYGTVLAKGAKVTTSRDAHPASRVIKRASSAGSTPRAWSCATCASPQRHQPLRGQERQRRGRHARAHLELGRGDDPDPGVRAARRGDRRDSARRTSRSTTAVRTSGAPSTASSARSSSPTAPWRPMCAALPRTGTWSASTSRAFRLVIDYSNSPASLMLPNLLGV